MTVNDAKYLVKIYRKKGLGSDTRETCCLFDKFRSLIDFSQAREQQQLTFDQEPERLAYEDDDIDLAF